MSSEAEELHDGFGEVPEELPLLPIRDLVVFPYMVVPLFVSREISMSAVESAVAQERLLFLCAQRAAGADVPGPSDLYRVGTIGKILRVKKMPDGQVKVLVQGLRRARYEQILSVAPSIQVRIIPIEEDVV